MGGLNAIIIMVFSGVLGSVTFAAEYYLSPAGDDTNLGTVSNKPWKTLDRLMTAQSILKPGDSVFFADGNYVINDSSKNDSYFFSAKGTESAPITYKNYNNGKPVILYDRRVIEGAGHKIAILPAAYTIFDGLTIRQTEESRIVAMEKDGVTVVDRDRYFADNVRAMFITANNVTLRNCEIDNFSSVGLAIKGSNALVENCTFKNSSNHGWYLQGSNGTYRYNVIDGSRQIPGAGIYGIQFQYEQTHHNKVYGNVIKNTAAAAFVFAVGTSDNEIYNNVLINSGSNRPSGYVLHTLTAGTGNKVYNNTAIGKTLSSIFGGEAVQLAKIDIRDNIFYPSSSIKTGLTETSPSIRNNIFYNVTNSVPTGNILKDPLLVNPLGLSATSARLKSGSPAIDAGLSTTFPETDFNRVQRVGPKYDIGAFEFRGGSTPLAPKRFLIKEGGESL